MVAEVSQGLSAPATKDPVELTERVRMELGRIICDRFCDGPATLSAIIFDPRLQAELRRCVQGKDLVLDMARLDKLVGHLTNAWRKAHVAGKEVALLTDATLRRPLRQALVRSLPDLGILSYHEVPNTFGLQPVALIRPEDL